MVTQWNSSASLGRASDWRRTLVIFLLFAAVCPLSADPIIIGSKKFTESYVLAEIARRALENAGIEAEHRQ